jgi:hypothetical protein
VGNKDCWERAGGNFLEFPSPSWLASSLESWLYKCIYSLVLMSCMFKICAWHAMQNFHQFFLNKKIWG